MPECCSGRCHSKEWELNDLRSEEIEKAAEEVAAEGGDFLGSLFDFLRNLDGFITAINIRFGLTVKKIAGCQNAAVRLGIRNAEWGLRTSKHGLAPCLLVRSLLAHFGAYKVRQVGVFMIS